jgi:hypothetical protein
MMVQLLLELMTRPWIASLLKLPLLLVLRLLLALLLPCVQRLLLLLLLSPSLQPCEHLQPPPLQLPSPSPRVQPQQHCQQHLAPLLQKSQPALHQQWLLQQQPPPPLPLSQLPPPLPPSLQQCQVRWVSGQTQSS